jgi:hypothetical protein
MLGSLPNTPNERANAGPRLTTREGLTRAGVTGGLLACLSPTRSLIGVHWLSCDWDAAGSLCSTFVFLTLRGRAGHSSGMPDSSAAMSSAFCGINSFSLRTSMVDDLYCCPSSPVTAMWSSFPAFGALPNPRS